MTFPPRSSATTTEWHSEPTLPYPSKAFPFLAMCPCWVRRPRGARLRHAPWPDHSAPSVLRDGAPGGRAHPHRRRVENAEPDLCCLPSCSQVIGWPTTHAPSRTNRPKVKLRRHCSSSHRTVALRQRHRPQRQPDGPGRCRGLGETDLGKRHGRTARSAANALRRRKRRTYRLKRGLREATGPQRGSHRKLGTEGTTLVDRSICRARSGDYFEIGNVAGTSWWSASRVSGSVE
jgi:hypothetical protein